MEERNKYYCPDCETEMNEIYEKPALNLTCPKCGYKLATTRWEKIDLDTTNYKISINSISNPLISQIKVISKITGSNFIASKKLLEDGGIVFEGLVLNVKPIIKLLTENDIPYLISLEYSY